MNKYCLHIIESCADVKRKFPAIEWRDTKGDDIIVGRLCRPRGLLYALGFLVGALCWNLDRLYRAGYGDLGKAAKIGTALRWLTQTKDLVFPE